ncbi:MAG: hypothetical protein PVH68_00615 [Armatimonadota bacterium]|jgi:hypothetical protein
MPTKDAYYYLRRTFTPCLILLAGMFLLRAWLDAWWVEYRVDRAMGRAARQTTVEARNESLAHAVDILDGYKRHVAGAGALIPRLDTTAIDKVRHDMDWYRLQTASVYQGSLEYEHWSTILDNFLTDYEVQDLGVMRPGQRRVLTAILWVLAAVSVVTFFIKMSWHEWGEF